MRDNFPVHPDSAPIAISDYFFWRVNSKKYGSGTWRLRIMASKERHYLTLEKKVELIKFFQKNPGTSVRALGEQFGCGRTQVGKILKSRESLLALYKSNASSSRIHTSVIQRPSEFEEVNKALYDWYKVACSKNIYPGVRSL